MSSYEEKYLKYKNKYLILKNRIKKMNGGVIGQIDTNKLDVIKTNDEIPEIIKNYVSMITIPDTEIIRVGSAMQKIQPFFSDVDVMNIVHKQVNSEQLVKFFIQNIKSLVQSIQSNPKVFFSDFKAGGLHWTVDQIVKEKNGELSLYDACFIKDVIKLDIIGPYNSRYLEMSTFFVLKSINQYINVESDYFSGFKKSLLVDIAHYQESKPFKAIKRVWSLSRINKDTNTMEILKDLIKSNISLVSQVNADIETLILLVEHQSNYDKEFVLNELDGFRERLASILDIQLDFEKINLMIDNIKLLFKFSAVEIDKNLIGSLERLHNYLLKIINKETLDYLSSIQYKFPVDKTTEPITDYEETEVLDVV
jgi:hypothetical protein